MAALPKLSKILEDVVRHEKPRDRVAALRSHYPNQVLLKLLKYAYDDSVEWLLPVGAPPYKKAEFANADGGLYQESRKLYMFIRCPESENIHPVRRETLFVDMLETIDPEEAKLLIAVKDNKISEVYRGLTKSVVRKAFPELLK